ncbi:MAG: ABC transporter ATP-binding protein [Candidatus Kariarchaeaceae archaeon]|jgi:ABC-2 type transport system ATP-binding protein
MSNYNIVASLDHVVKAFGDVVAVSDASFAIEKGRIMGFLGPNGAGKTTSIRMILGLLKPQHGHVQLFGVDPFINARVKQLVGYIPEENAFPKWIQARDYLESLARFQLPREEAKRRTQDVLEEVELTEVADKRIRQFSKGMRQRMKVAQALMHKPALIIADEPFNGLDPVVRKKMFDLFDHYKTEYNSTFFVSSHILFEVEKLADKIILLYKGRTIAQGSPYRIREMIQDQPHSIQITTPETKQLTTHLINQANEKIVSSIEFKFDTRSGDRQLSVLTLDPRTFYNLLTDIVVDNDIPITELRATDEGLENLFKTLTVG